MTPQAVVKTRFCELAESLGLKVRIHRQKEKFYFTLEGDWKAQNRFVAATFPAAWMTSSGSDTTYGLPIADVEKLVASLQIDPAWLEGNDGTARKIAEKIRDDRLFGNLPILADALEEAGCGHAEILRHCREQASHQSCCWVIELLLGPARKRTGKIPPLPDPDAAVRPEPGETSGATG